MDRDGASLQAQGRVELAASTGDITARDNESTSSTSRERSPTTRYGERDDDHNGGLRDYFETAQWTADGTTILTSSSSNLISGYIVPEDLLSPTASRPLKLVPQAAIQLPEPSNVLAGAPYFRLAEPWTQQLLVSARDHPIQLFYLSSSSSSSSPSPSQQEHQHHQKPASCYPLTKARSETFLSATSLAWPSPGTHFVAGARNLLAQFDVARAGGGPLRRVKTIPSDRHPSKGGGVGMRGAVSALAAQPPDARHASLVAAATWTRWVGLYDFAAPDAGACVATWSVARAADGHGGPGGGGGVAQAVWSPCGRYLLLGERKSAGILVYDVRVTGKLLGWLAGRDALGNQRIACDVFPGQGQGEGEAGFEVWSGSTHGDVKVWEGVGTREGAHEPAWGWSAARRSTVSSTCMHQSGAVVATCSGSWEFPEEGEESGGDDESGPQSESSSSEAPWMRRRNRESSLKIWSLSNNGYEASSPEGDRDGKK
ncbi:hypothetical protein F4820DRAFT_466410 [Hypoxylon rubiginosum]|uniref:Uncharacterized protein n=1 Tax=Hypoxylon rubiginosum TaxID=110542 RepID=A0ACB9YKP3_9PEZI|nr:hypothetical protein F4820DRAFT_466410 [Hypoxylon rubiginosum]